ncbi:MAG: TetR/AcrR family transcriptional regulator [Oscillospiraceae bacterium]|nr:TetR/AcrR family transcriptional regulator [Oscillospiraceae bacterium]
MDLIPLARNLSTKEKILYVAIHLFFERGCERVPVKDIADLVGIKTASVYNYFGSKGDLVGSIYEFYAVNQRLHMPNLDTLLRLAETLPLAELFSRIEYYYPPDLEKLLGCILGIAAREANTDPRGARLIKECIFGSLEKIVPPLLSRLTELGRIEPVDIPAFLSLLNYYCVGTAVLDISPLRISKEDWRKGLMLLYSTIRPAGG